MGASHREGAPETAEIMKPKGEMAPEGPQQHIKISDEQE